MAQTDVSQVLNDIYKQRKTAPLSILSLAEPILHPEPPHQSQTQTQTQAQSQSQSQPQNATVTPASLIADLAHYKDLFSKLRFSYLEQVTKEKYLRGIVGEPPILATSESNSALEEKLSVMKTDLQAKKRHVEALVQEMEALAKDIAERYDGVNAAVVLLETLPGEVAALENEVEQLKMQLNEKEVEWKPEEGEEVDAGMMDLSLEETERLLEEQRREDEELKRRVAELEREMEDKVRECEKAERELEDVEVRRNEITRVVREAQRRKEEGGRDLLEEQGRWYKSSEIVMKGLLGVQT